MSKKLNKFIGNEGESIAEKYLKQNKYVILEKNFSTQLGEIDIIANKDEYLVFVEVKARRNIEFGYPSEAVTLTKQRKISMVASQYISKNMLFNAAVRFDVIEVYIEDGRINHIENAFDSYLKY